MRDQFFEYLTSEGFVLTQDQYVKTFDEYIEVYSVTENDGEVLHELKKLDGTTYEKETITLTF